MGPGPASASTVAINAVTKSFGSAGDAVHALGPISLTVEPSKFISIVGPSGCGKTTLLMVTAGLVPPSTGEVVINGTSVTKPITDVGVVFQKPALLDWRDNLGNVLLQLEGRGLDIRPYRDAAALLLRQVGLAGFEHRRPYELSGGMQQRVAICRALIHEPPLLLMDEPFGALDAITRSQLGLDLQRIWMQHPTTVLFITHGIAEAVFLSDQVIVMSDRPGTIDAIIDIDIPRPRHLGVQRQPDYLGYVTAIEDMFKARGVLRDEPDQVITR